MNEIICGNCVDVMATFPDNYIDLTVTSPPYDNLRDYKGYEFDFECIANELYRITKQGGVVVWVVGDATKDFCESLTSFRQAICFVDICGFNLLDTMIYEKNGYPPQYPNMMRYVGAFEYMLVFSKGKPNTFNPIHDRLNSQVGAKRDASTQRQTDGSTKKTKTGFEIGKISKRTNIWKYNTGYMKVTSDKWAYNHPAIFPEKLANDHIITWSNEGDLILDPMCGSGTTCKMAMVNNRNYIGIDTSEEYCEIARNRISEYKQQLSLF